MNPRAIAALEVACAASGLRLTQILARSRRGDLVEGRRLACVLLRGAGFTHAQIARLLHRHHSTVIHHLRQSDDLLDVDPAWARTVESAARGYALATSHPTEAA